MGRAIRCLIRMVAAWPRLRLIRVCASYNKTFPEHEAFILINPVGETHVPRTAPGTPEANGRPGCPRPPRPSGGRFRPTSPRTSKRTVDPRTVSPSSGPTVRSGRPRRRHKRASRGPGRSAQTRRSGSRPPRCRPQGDGPWTLAKGCPRGAPLAPRKGDEPASPLKNQ